MSLYGTHNIENVNYQINMKKLGKFIKNEKN